jgi:raffinose/stachyose/melibiose transport system substrate-binding protein
MEAMYYPAVFDTALQSNGYLGVFPLSLATANIVIANLEVLDDVGLEPAQTYSELVEQVPVLRAGGYDTIVMPNLPSWVMQTCLYSTIIGRFMGKGWHERVLAGRTDFNDPAFIASLAFVQQMYEDGVISASSLEVDYHESPTLFAENNGAYYVDGDWRINAFLSGEAMIPTSRQGHFYVTVFPEIDLPDVMLPGRTNAVTLDAGWGINANLANGSPELEAAWTLVKWLVSPEVQAVRLRSGTLSIPSAIGVDVDTALLGPLQVMAARLPDEFDIATVFFDRSFAAPVFEALKEQLKELGQDNTTPEEAAEVVQAIFMDWKEK